MLIDVLQALAYLTSWKWKQGLKIGVIFPILIHTLQQFMSWGEVLPGPYLLDLSCDFLSGHCASHRCLPADFLRI